MKTMLNQKEVYVYEIRTDHKILCGDDKKNHAKALYIALGHACRKNDIEATFTYSNYHVEAKVSGTENGLAVIKTLEMMMRQNKFELQGFEVRISNY